MSPSQPSAVIRVVLPAHLRTLAQVKGEVALELAGSGAGAGVGGGAGGESPSPVTPRAIFDALEARFPTLLGTIRDRTTHRRRPLVRFFACGRDISHESPDAPVPDAVARGAEPFLIIGAMAGG